MSLAYWFMFPVSIGVATVAMASGVEGATFFAPIFLLALGLSPEVAIGTGLITEVFGFASGLVAYVRKRLIDYRLARTLLLVTIPVALLGSWAAGWFEPDVLKAILGMGLFVVAFSFFRSPEPKDVVRLDRAIEEEYGGEKGESCVSPAEGEPICYTVCNKAEGRFMVGLGALFMGMISTGLGELNGYFLLHRCRVPSSVAVATSVLVVAFTALAAASGHLIRFVRAGGDTLETVLALAVFTVPGVVLGAQLGASVASRVPAHALERILGVLFALIGALLLTSVTV